MLSVKRGLPQHILSLLKSVVGVLFQLTAAFPIKNKLVVFMNLAVLTINGKTNEAGVDLIIQRAAKDPACMKVNK